MRNLIPNKMMAEGAHKPLASLLLYVRNAMLNYYRFLLGMQRIPKMKEVVHVPVKSLWISIRNATHNAMEEEGCNALKS
jgi:hypothetical protein